MKSQMIDPSQIITRRKDGSVDVGTHNEEPSMTQQQFKDDCDINNIMKKHGGDAVALAALSRGRGVYADMSELPSDYRGMLETIQKAEDAFLSMTAETRKRFDNDPAKFLDFLQDPKNYDEGVKLGLLNERKNSTAADKTNEQNDQKQSSAVEKK